MKRSILFLLLVVFVLTSACTTLVSADSMELVYDGAVHTYTGPIVKLVVGGKTIVPDVPPIILNDRTMIPVRAVLEELGATLSFDGPSQTVTATLGDYRLDLKIGSVEATLNLRQKLTMEVPARIINDRTMIPLRFVSESLGLVVGWIAEQETATVDLPAGGLPTIQKSTLQAISAQTAQDTTVQIQTDQAVSYYETFYLDNPARVVVDLYDTVRGAGVQNSLTVGDGNVSAVRTSQYYSVPAVTRVVVDLAADGDYQVVQSVDKKTLTVTVEGTGTDDPPVVDPEPPVDDPEMPVVDGMPTLLPAAADKLVVLDPGHGGTDPGALGYDENGNVVLRECDVTLDIVKRLDALLKQCGVKTKMTRETDVLVPLMEIPEIANEAGASLFLSVHCNSFSTPDAYGTETLYYNDVENPAYGISSKRFASIAHEEMMKTIGTYDRGLKERPNLVVLKYTEMPAILAETAFISNEEDREKLMSDDFKNKVATALCRAVILALNESVS